MPMLFKDIASRQNFRHAEISNVNRLTIGFLEDDLLENFRLYLSPLRSITEEELLQCEAIHGKTECSFISRYDHSVRVGNLQLFFDGKLYNHD